MYITGLLASARRLQALQVPNLTIGLCLAVFTHSAHADEAAPVTVVEVHSQPLVETISLNGTITAERNSSLSSRVSGLVDTVAVDAGDQVTVGETLIQLDTALAELALARTRAAVEEARAQLDEARRLRDEARKLQGSRTIPETQVRATEAEVAIREAALQRLQVEQSEQAERLRRHTLVAPFAGVIANKLTETGEWINTGTPVLELVETERLRLDVRAPQRLHQSIRAMMPVTVRSEVLGKDEISGEVQTLVPVNDPDVRTFLVRIQIDNRDNLLMPGMSAQAIFDIGTDESGLLIPRDAVTQQPNGTSSVWVIKQSDDKATVSRMQVKLGRTLSDNVEVREGLTAGQSIVLEGNEVLSEGQPVRILNPDRTAEIRSQQNDE